MKKTTEIIEIKKPEIVVVPIRIVGDTPLIMHKWSEKAKRMMLDKQMKKKTAGHDAKNPVEDFIDSIYWLEGEPQEKTEEGFEAAIAGGAWLV